MSDTVDPGDYVYDHLTTGERVHLANAMHRACLDDSNEFHDNLGNAGFSTIIQNGAHAGEVEMRKMCRQLTELRLIPGQDQVDWDCLLSNAFGRNACERVRGLYIEATGLTDEQAFADAQANRQAARQKS